MFGVHLNSSNIEPTLTALSEPLLVTYPLNPPSKGGLCEACGFA